MFIGGTLDKPIRKDQFKWENRKYLIIFLGLLAAMRVIASTILGFNDNIPFYAFSPMPRVFQSDNFFAFKEITFTLANGEKFVTHLSGESDWPFFTDELKLIFDPMKILDRPQHVPLDSWRRLTRFYFCDPEKRELLSPKLQTSKITHVKLYFKVDPKIKNYEINREVACPP